MATRPDSSADGRTGAVPVPTRERILLAAGKLFHGEGIRAVSLDAVAARAGVTKRTVYYHFRSKDDLVAAYLEARDPPNLDWFRRHYSEAAGDVATRIEALFAALAGAAAHPRWKGCGFLRSSVELVKTPGHPAMNAARAHKKRLEDWLCGLFQVARADGARELARQIVLLIDGGFAVVLLNRDAGYMDSAGRAAGTLVRAALARGREPRHGEGGGEGNGGGNGDG
ncbi:TetR/AcrR family transcriptional regulator [Ancylobacter dichloromethanicus]|uniref:TetR family transcriptional regulator n=1 Tax=Ancylobacter dichloromethanicus TaxID=518825 RepID=A0A9W6JBR1_9HYPH|nr:TetR/AcrR family transcriptional regulator [Ancylobacter dichloromethanicus]MBS7554972.1 TetR/AcrR family transcriptional regulator [Ancylobacter dichloromethanicus]GLK73368.1 TetR family transcriptional regulator [Ancylobacter dichloromethanicus]